MKCMSTLEQESVFNFNLETMVDTNTISIVDEAT